MPLIMWRQEMNRINTHIINYSLDAGEMKFLWNAAAALFTDFCVFED